MAQGNEHQGIEQLGASSGSPVQILHQGSTGLYSLYEARVYADGLVRGTGMGRPYVEVNGESQQPIDKGLIVSIDVAVVGATTDDKEVSIPFSRSLDFITTQTSAGIALAHLGLSRLLQTLPPQEQQTRVSPTEIIEMLSQSVVAVDSDVRKVAFEHGDWLPETVTSRKTVSFISQSPGMNDSNMLVPIFLHEDSTLGVTPSKQQESVRVGEIILENRRQDLERNRPATELYERADWWIRATHPSYWIRAFTGSRLEDESVATETARLVHGNNVYRIDGKN